ncbi:hypothetical protein CPB97_002126 [Podila verticillata]|nr:hypothetical protein CPB97_002126 [Podila verticillata]
MVNKKLNAIVSSLEDWSRMFAVAHGPKAHLRPLVGILRSKSYMVFMCSSSLHICERCFGLTRYNADNLSKLPLPIPILLPRRSTDTITYLGERFDPNWTIRMCLPCRQGHILEYEEPLPRLAEKSQLDWHQLRQKYPCTQQVLEFIYLPRGKLVDEVTVIKHMRRHLGGDVGIEASKASTRAYDEKTEAKIRWYQLQA